MSTADWFGIFGFALALVLGYFEVTRQLAERREAKIEPKAEIRNVQILLSDNGAQFLMVEVGFINQSSQPMTIDQIDWSSLPPWTVVETDKTYDASTGLVEVVPFPEGPKAVKLRRSDIVEFPADVDAKSSFRIVRYLVLQPDADSIQTGENDVWLGVGFIGPNNEVLAKAGRDITLTIMSLRDDAAK